MYIDSGGQLISYCDNSSGGGGDGGVVVVASPTIFLDCLFWIKSLQQFTRQNIKARLIWIFIRDLDMRILCRYRQKVVTRIPAICKGSPKIKKKIKVKNIQKYSMWWITKSGTALVELYHWMISEEENRKIR